MTIRKVHAFCCLISLAAACADSGGSAENVQGSRPSLSRCRDGWDRILDFQPMTGTAPDVLRWHAGSLYYAERLDFSPRVVSVPDTGGTATEVTDDAGRGLWIEDGSVLFTHFDRLYSAPLSGGETTLVSNGETFGIPEKPENVALLNQELDASSLYWVLHRFTDPTWSVWRAPREGGPSEQLGTLPDSLGYPEALVALPDQLMVAGNDGDAYLFPKQGGDVQRLPTVASQRDEVMWSRFVGAAPSGILWAVASQVKSPKQIPYAILLSTPDGNIEELWRDMPDEIEPDHVWPDGAGGWLIAGLELFSDGERHTSIWSLDANDRAKRLACDARPGRASGYAVASALSDDAAYLIVEYFAASEQGTDEDAESTGWTLVKIER